MERRLSITIKGGISLGAYEAGVLTETLNLLKYNNEHSDESHPCWYIDSLAGASAGSVTAAMTALALLSGDPSLLHDIWVNFLSFDTLAPANDQSLNNCQLLDSAALDQLAHDHLVLPSLPADGSHRALRPRGSIRLRMTLSHLIGEPQFVPTITGEFLSFNTFKDCASFKIGFVNNALSLQCDNGFAAHAYSGAQQVTGAAAWEALIQCAITSGSFPFAFAPRHLRKWDNVLTWADAHYQDGGIYDNDPVGQSVNLAHEIDWYEGNSAFRDDERRFLIVHTEPFMGRPKAIIPGAVKLLDINPFELATTLIPNILGASTTSGLIGIGEVNKLFDARREFLTKLASMVAKGDFPDLEPIVTKLAKLRGVDHLNVLRDALLPDLQLSKNEADQNIYNEIENCSINVKQSFVWAALAFDLALDIADKVEFKPMLIAPTGKLSGDPAYAFGGFLVRDLRERDFRQGVADAYREWTKVSERCGDFVLRSQPPPEPETVDQVAKRTASLYTSAAERMLKRVDAVISGLAEGATKGQGLGGELKALFIKVIGEWYVGKLVRSGK